MIADEQEIFACGYCRVPILTFWAPNQQGLERGEYVLAGDVFFHPKCFDAWVAPLYGAAIERAGGQDEVDEVAFDVDKYA